MLIGLASCGLSQDRTWQQFSGDIFSFTYPPSWRVNAQSDRNVVVGNPANGATIEFAMTPGNAGSVEKLALNAEKHVMQFAQKNNAYAKFESAKQIETGAVRVISHVCSMMSENPNFCRPDDRNTLDVSSVISPLQGRILLIEVMHRPGFPEQELNTLRRVVRTLQLK
jgi:hypothetical protein